MTTLPALLNFIVTTLQLFPICADVKVTEMRVFSEDQFFCKVRADLGGGLSFQVRVYYNRGHYDYAYQLFHTTPLLRWDNKEDVPGLPNFPHHRHDAHGDIVASALHGDPIEDLPVVLREIEQHVTALEREPR